LNRADADSVRLMLFDTASETPEQKAARKAAKASMDPAAKVAFAPLLLGCFTIAPPPLYFSLWQIFIDLFGK
jgi:hypothetical protein